MTSTTRRQVLIGGAALGAAQGLNWLAPFPAFGVGTDGGVARAAIFKPAGNLDPQKYVGIWGVQAAVFDPLIHYGQAGVSEPALAESWSLSDDRKVIKFHLRQGVTFSDNVPWNAETMIWNMRRWIGTERANWLSISRDFEDLVALDDMTVELRLARYVPQALQELVIVRPVRFLSPKAVTEDGSYRDPVGTGPWKVEINDEARTVLVRNESHWGNKPAFERFELIVIPDARSRISALRAGDIDICGGRKVGPLTPQDALALEGSDGIKVYRAPGPDTMILGFNSEREILQDKRVREAINLSIDRQGIAKGLLSGFAVPTMNLFPEIIPYSGKRLEVPAREVTRAAELLEASGWTGAGVRNKNGRPLALELVISEEAIPGSRALGEVIQGQLAEAGFDIKLRQVDHLTRHDDIPAKKYDLALFVTNGAPYDPHATFLSLFLSTRAPGTDGKIFLDTRLDPLLLAAVEALEDEKEAAHQTVYDWLAEHHAIAPLYHGTQIWAHSHRIANFALPPTEYELPFAGIEIVS